MQQLTNIFRIGCRYATAEDICIEEDNTLSDYLSNCKLDQAKHCLHLPDETEHGTLEGFDCVFYREAEERMYEATLDGESFIVIVLNENGWDSDFSEKRETKRVCYMLYSSGNNSVHAFVAYFAG